MSEKKQAALDDETLEGAAGGFMEFEESPFDKDDRPEIFKQMEQFKETKVKQRSFGNP